MMTPLTADGQLSPKGPFSQQTATLFTTRGVVRDCNATLELALPDMLGFGFPDPYFCRCARELCETPSIRGEEEGASVSKADIEASCSSLGILPMP